jgi:hypothetical protein
MIEMMSMSMLEWMDLCMCVNMRCVSSLVTKWIG